MITLLIDKKGVSLDNYIIIDYSDLPNTFDSGVDLQRLLHSKSLDGKDRYIAIDGVDNLDARKSSLLKKFLSSLPTTTKVLLTAQNEHNVSNHILQLQPRIKRIKGSRSKKEPTLWENMRLNMLTRQIPNDDDMYMFMRTIGDTVEVMEDNRELACRIDEMLFETHTEYLTTAWAGLHRKERTKLTIKPTKKKEKKPKMKKKIHPTMVKNRKKTVRKNLEEWL